MKIWNDEEKWIGNGKNWENDPSFFSLKFKEGRKAKQDPKCGNNLSPNPTQTENKFKPHSV